MHVVVVVAVVASERENAFDCDVDYDCYDGALLGGHKRKRDVHMRLQHLRSPDASHSVAVAVHLLSSFGQTSFHWLLASSFAVVVIAVEWH